MRKTKTTLAYEKLKTFFQQGIFEKNRCITTSEIADMAEFGRAPVLAALRRLETEEFLVIVPQKGIVISEMTLKDMREINDIRSALEPFIVRQIAPNFSEADVTRLYAEIEELRLAERTGDGSRFVAADEHFHLRLVELTRNTRMVVFIQRLWSRLFIAGLHGFAAQPTTMSSTIQDHLAIAQALEKRDGEAAAQAMTTHLRNGRQLMF